MFLSAVQYIHQTVVLLGSTVRGITSTVTVAMLLSPGSYFLKIPSHILDQIKRVTKYFPGLFTDVLLDVEKNEDC